MAQVKTSLGRSRIMKALMAKPKGERKVEPDPAIDRLRAICLALPETTERVAWSEPTFRVRGKLFAQLDNHHHGAGHLAVWLPMPLGAQEGLVYMDPVRTLCLRTWEDAAGSGCESTGGRTGRRSRISCGKRTARWRRHDCRPHYGQRRRRGSKAFAAHADLASDR